MEQVLPFTFALMILGTGSYSADNETTSQESKPEHSQNNLIETEHIQTIYILFMLCFD